MDRASSKEFAMTLWRVVAVMWVCPMILVDCTSSILPAGNDASLNLRFNSNGMFRFGNFAIPAAAFVAKDDSLSGEVAEVSTRVGLAAPIPKRCVRRKIDFTYKGHAYQASWLHGADRTSWIGARNVCRRQCMDLVSLETPQENTIVKIIVENAWNEGAISDVWTSGRLCDFHGCDREDLQPIRVNGWFWSGSSANIAAPGKGFTDWGIDQPDDREGEESCVAMSKPDGGSGSGSSPGPARGRNDGFRWHDAYCQRPKAFLCEDADGLIGYVNQTSPGLLDVPVENRVEVVE